MIMSLQTLTLRTGPAVENFLNNISSVTAGLTGEDILLSFLVSTVYAHIILKRKENEIVHYNVPLPSCRTNHYLS